MKKQKSSTGRQQYRSVFFAAIFCTASLFAATSCAEAPETGDSGQAGAPITFRTETLTRVATDAQLNTEFQFYDEIGVFAVVRTNAQTQAYPSATASENLMHNVKFVRQVDGSWRAEQAYYFPQNATADFYAYYPYKENANPTNIGYDATVVNNDLMTARTTGIAETSDPVNLVFRHKLALVHVEIDGQDALSQMSVIMNGVAYSGKLDLTAQNQADEFTANTDKVNLSLVNKLGFFCAYIPAQALDKDIDLFTLNDGGKDMFYQPASGATLVNGGIKRYHITPGATGMDPLKLPNTYLIAPGSRISIPVAKAFAVWEDNDVLAATTYDMEGTMTAELVWQDVNGLIPASGITLTGTGKDASIKIQTDASKGSGNAVVALKIGGDIYWSWHVWVTPYEPNDPNNQDFNGWATFMDRNLGAVSSIIGDAGAAGFLYQWGRKDPFPTPGQWPSESNLPTADQTEFDPRPLWNAQGAKAEIVTGELNDEIAVNLTNSIRKPNMVIKSRDYTPPYDWYAVEKHKGDDRWDKDGNKTVFDPCPAGWRVPTSGIGTASPWYDLLIYSWLYGPFWYQAGYYPAAGYMSSLTGKMKNYSLMGYYWSATSYDNPADQFAYDGGAYNFHFLTKEVGDILTNTRNFRGMGMSVRCVKE